jgi:hypothetical protein
MLITKARPAAALNLTTAPAIIAEAGSPQKPCLLSLSGASNFALKLFSVTATGFITPGQAGLLSLILYGQPNVPNLTPKLVPSTWVAMATTPGEPVGGVSDPVSTQWMIQGVRMMYYLSSGKMQGESLSNIAAHPIPAAILDNPLLGLLPNIDPVCMFAIGAFFAPDVPPIGTAPICQLTDFYLSDGA